MLRRAIAWLKSLSEGLSRTKLLGMYLGVIFVVTTVYSVIYRYIMAAHEGAPVSMARAFQVVLQTMTTTGFGGDAPYVSTAANLFMPLIMVTGILLIFLTLPLFVVPWLEEMITERPPSTIDDIMDHIVIAGSVSAHDALIQECEDRGLEYVLIEQDEERAMGLHKDGYTVISGDLTSPSILSRANIEAAAHLVTDIDPETAASLILAARERTEDLGITSIAPNEMADHLLYAGADGVLSPRQLVGRSLADKLATSVNARFDEAVKDLGEDYRVVELPVYESSPVAGKTLATSGLWDARRATVIGAWHHGHFIPAPDPSLQLDRQTELLVSGYMDDITDLWEEKFSRRRQQEIRKVMVAGYGQSGKSIVEELRSHGVETTVVDKQDLDGVDVVGTVEDAATFEEAGLRDHDVLVLAVSDDETAVFGTIVARQIAEDLEIVVRANEEVNVRKLTRAGADYVLSLETVTGRMTARYVLEETIPSGTRIEMLRTELPQAVGEELDLEQIRADYNITVIAVHRDDVMETDVNGTLTIGDGDEVVLAGPTEQLDAFRDSFTDGG